MAGQFVIQGLDESLIFNVLVTAHGFTTVLESEVDPSAAPLELKLAAANNELPEDRLMTGIVVDQQGNPVLGALVSIRGATQGDRRWGGRVRNVDKVSVTNEQGKFLLTSRESYDQWSLSVEATGFVNHKTDRLDTGDKLHKIHLDPGCTVVGTVKDVKGEPVENLQVGICQTDRGSNTFSGEYVIATDQDGRFEFTSVVPSDEFTIYSKLVNKDQMGMFELESFDSAKSGSTKELGLFKVDPGRICSVVGRVVLTDGNMLPRDMRLLVSREKAWDSQVVDVADDGSFRIDGLARNEDYSFTIRLTKYRLSAKKNSLQQTQPWQVAMHVSKNVQGFEIYLEPEPEVRNQPGIGTVR